MPSTHSLRPRDLVMLQQSAGNQAVSRLLQVNVAPDSRVPTLGEAAAPEAATPLGRVERLRDRIRLVAGWSVRWAVD